MELTKVFYLKKVKSTKCRYLNLKFIYYLVYRNISDVG